MGEHTKIEWATDTVNFWWGCTKVSPACEHCYAESRDRQFHPTFRAPHGFACQGAHWGPDAPRMLKVASALRDLARIRRRAIKTGERPRVFVNSMSDFFEDRRDLDEARLAALDAMRQAPEVDFLLLTKRPEAITALLNQAHQDAYQPHGIHHRNEELAKWLRDWRSPGICEPPRNIWLGTTAENQEWADKRVSHLLAVPAALHFLSLEPLLGPVDLTMVKNEAADIEGRIDWVIVGGESGPHARPTHPDWALRLRDQCAAAGVPFFFKQWGEWRPVNQGPHDWYEPLYKSRKKAMEGEDQTALDEVWGKDCTVAQLCLHSDGSHLPVMASGAWRADLSPMQAFRVGKKGAGRLLYGEEHSAFPEVCQ